LKRNRVVAAIAASVILGLLIVAMVLMRDGERRQRVFRPGTGEPRTVVPREVPPVEKWTPTFEAASATELAGLLEEIQGKHGDLYEKWSLSYLHARALVEMDDRSKARPLLEPYTRSGHPFRDRALYHLARVSDKEEASQHRTTLLFEHPDSAYREEAIDEEIEYLSSAGNRDRLIAFADRLAPSAPPARRREISARIVEALVADGELAAARTRGLALLEGSIADDAADRVVRALHRPEVLAQLTPAQLARFGETFQRHRHFDEAVTTLERVLQNRYNDDLQFALGRSHFGNEKYDEAQAVYLRGAQLTKEPRWRVTFLWHAARSLQLRGDDAGAERLMTSAIGVKGNFPSTKAALTQRLRTRIVQKRYAEAAADLALLRQLAGNERAHLEGALAYGVGMIAAGNPGAALAAFNAVPRRLLDPYDVAEFGYWRARALENSDPPAAFRSYLEVLRSSAPTHFAYFARQRLDSKEMESKLARELALREAEVTKHLEAKDFELAKRIQTDRILLSSRDSEAQLKRLAAIYRELPSYRTILELKPEELPRFPTVDPSDSDALLMAMGLQDEAVGAIEKRWALRPVDVALTRAHALNLAAASRPSIYAIEVMMRSVPDDFHPELLPELVRRLLYPRYFYDFIAADSKKYDADPRLVLSIMREESRFDPRAKSQAAARGLLQFIITTARDIGRAVGLVDVKPQDLYDPRIIIQLGAKYVSELAGQFDGNRYRVAGAYNAGPKQVALWSRMQAAPGNDYFLTAVNFDETKHYIRKVMNSWERYGEIYGDEGPVGGLQIEP
jgi:soluble lytic murein transglycosylase-like protein